MSEVNCSFDSVEPMRDVSPLLLSKLPKKTSILPVKGFTLPLLQPSLAWECNFLTMAFLGAFLAILSESHRSYVYGLLGVIAFDATVYYNRKSTMAGVPYTFPFVALASMILDPVRFWSEQTHLAVNSEEGMSSNTLIGTFVVLVTDTKLCQEILASDGIVRGLPHPDARWLLGSRHSMNLDDDEAYKTFRCLLTPLLLTYDAPWMTQGLVDVCRNQLNRICVTGKTSNKAMDVRIAFGSLTSSVSQELFLGPHINDAFQGELDSDIHTLVNGFIWFPFPFLNNRLARTIHAKTRILRQLMTIIPNVRSYLDTGKEPRCLLEHWVSVINSVSKDKAHPQFNVSSYTDLDVVTSVLAFMISVQTNFTSSLTYSIDILATRPDVVSRIRIEIIDVGVNNLLTMIQDPAKLTYTRKVSTQILQHRPPVAMIPCLTKQATTLGKRSIPKGTIVIVADRTSLPFNPDSEIVDTKITKTTTFGGGNHQCPVSRFAESMLTVFLAVLVDGYDFERVGSRPSVEDVMYCYSTVFPLKNDFLFTRHS